MGWNPKVEVRLQSIVSKAEAKAIRKAAETKGMSVSQYIRLVIVPIAADA